MTRTQWAIIAVLAMMVVCVFCGVAFLVFTTKMTYTVGYDAFGDGSITYRNEYGNIEQAKFPSGDHWSKTFNAKSGDFLYISAQTGKLPFVTCFISVNDKVRSEAKSEVAYGIATCSYRLP